MKSCEVFESRKQRSINAFYVNIFATPRNDINPFRRDDKLNTRTRKTHFARKFGRKVTKNFAYKQIFCILFAKFTEFDTDLVINDGAAHKYAAHKR